MTYSYAQPSYQYVAEQPQVAAPAAYQLPSAASMVAAPQAGLQSAPSMVAYPMYAGQTQQMYMPGAAFPPLSGAPGAMPETSAPADPYASSVPGPDPAPAPTGAAG